MFFIDINRAFAIVWISLIPVPVIISYGCAAILWFITDFNCSVDHISGSSPVYFLNHIVHSATDWFTFAALNYLMATTTLILHIVNSLAAAIISARITAPMGRCLGMSVNNFTGHGRAGVCNPLFNLVTATIGFIALHPRLFIAVRG
jgi:hypothetical protein